MTTKVLMDVKRNFPMTFFNTIFSKAYAMENVKKTHWRLPKPSCQQQKIKLFCTLLRISGSKALRMKTSTVLMHKHRTPHKHGVYCEGHTRSFGGIPHRKYEANLPDLLNSYPPISHTPKCRHLIRTQFNAGIHFSKLIFLKCMKQYGHCHFFKLFPTHFQKSSWFGLPSQEPWY